MPVTLAEYRNRYPDSTFLIIGKGRTYFDYRELRGVRAPVIFINEAVRLEHFARDSAETFFFAHDAHMAELITPEMHSVPVLPRADAVSSGGRRQMIHFGRLDVARLPARVVCYEWGGRYSLSIGSIQNVLRRQCFLATVYDPGHRYPSSHSFVKEPKHLMVA